MEEKLIKTIQLKNNIKIDIYDKSKRMAGDRWLVSLFTRMEIPVVKSVFTDGNQPGQDMEEIKETLGEKVFFEQKRERIFIDEQDKDKLLVSITDRFMDNTLPYLSRSEFPGKYIMKKYRDVKTSEIYQQKLKQQQY